MMSLGKYHKKRNFKKTSEPRGKKKQPRSSKLLYVIQQHAARNLHYDLRLEMNGVLKSWAIPKGPSTDPKVKRLAVHVEDHPIDYGSFEGVIPKGHYGAGVVNLWDQGEWECLDENRDKAYKEGHLTVFIKGKKLYGIWKLIRIKTDPDNWLFMKVQDEYSREEDRELSGIKSKMPTTIKPQLATLIDKPPLGDNWLHEVKFDGYRLISFINKSNIKLMTRNHQNWTNKFNHLVEDLKKLKLSTAIFDGELVAINDQGQFDFQLLQNQINNKDTDLLFYYIFDILYYNGYNLTELSQIKRKIILKDVLKDLEGAICYSDHVVGDGDKVYKKACELGLEGIISKEINSPYIQKRGDFWLKEKCVKRQEFIVCGFTNPKGKREHFGSLLLGFYDKNNKLTYCGHVGTGFNDKSLSSISKLLKKFETSKMPFDKRPPESKQVTWLKPCCVAEVQFTEWTQEKILRHPSFKGIRTDKDPKEIHQEKPLKTNTKRGKSNAFVLTNPDKILYPNNKITKLDIAEYYDEISHLLLPHIINRPLTLLRCPQGIDQDCFYQRHISETSIKSIHTVKVKHMKDHEPYLYIKDKLGLMSLIQLGVLEIHPWGVQVDKVDKPDLIIFDLDPAPDVEWKRVIKAAHFIRAQLEKIELVSFVKTTGGKGLHITIPIKRLYTWQQIQNFTQAFSKTLAELDPTTFTSIMTKSKRAGKIYVDYLRNQQGATAIAPYSIRAKAEASIAAPLSWEELTAKVKANSFTINNIFKRLAKLTVEPWQGYFNLHQTLKLI